MKTIAQRRKELKEYAEEKDRTLSSNINFEGKATIQHGDGSKFILENAEIEEKDGFLIVFTEHCGFFIFHKGDLDKGLEVDGYWKYEKY